MELKLVKLLTFLYCFYNNFSNVKMSHTFSYVVFLVTKMSIITHSHKSSSIPTELHTSIHK